MGRKSGRTKTGRSINPADAHRKQQRRKELKKNKEERKRVRLIASANKDLPKLEEELQQLKEIEKERYLDKYEKDKKKSLEEEISKVKEAREKLGIPINNEKKTTGQETVKLLGIHSAKHDKHEDKKLKSKHYSSSSSESESDSDRSDSSDSDTDSSYSSDSSSSEDTHKHKHKHKHKHDTDNPDDINQDEVDMDDVAQAEMMEEMEKMLPLINEEDLYNIELPKEPLPPEDKRIKIFQNLIDIPEIKAKINTPIPNIPLQLPPMNGNVPFMPPPGMIRPNNNFRPPTMPIPIPMNPNNRPPMMIYPPNVRPPNIRPPMGMPIPPNGMIPMNMPPNAPVRPLSNRPIPMNQAHPNKTFKPTGPPGHTNPGHINPSGHVNLPSTNDHESANMKPAPAAVISAAPQLRDLQKELTTLVPSSLRRRGQTTHKSSRKSTISSNSVKPTINLAPEFDENGQIKTQPESDTSKTNENDNNKYNNNKQDDYEAFMKEVSELL
ncbi:hypothetical protein H8356DRAFT_1725698 [Neocallimastix lanati (nom. inval.)]|jgi:hypothetical protein|uniref:Wbp11/ELF5/Saf1 N-terminal domain-containing protein n=1 Tax=Neocallimastix californiae TaxID=1754190 RepID=A0A1Y2ENC3_9FUNG|nr:hypothetical protein H8356DRAFT_1725698 [Neocallimastix sp. JGI-2020a]ORY72999.1 hypothetical protein LY90DRAFT_699775 [Neocallimastix californiae]|eukprot:ORY72999.1 hypothetical protein LY90DRAFT_699775 [Neocallimastix californiae]